MTCKNLRHFQFRDDLNSIWIVYNFSKSCHDHFKRWRGRILNPRIWRFTFWENRWGPWIVFWYCDWFVFILSIIWGLNLIKKRFVFFGGREGGKKLFNLGKKTFHFWLNKSHQQFPSLLYGKLERVLERNIKIREGLVGKKLLKVFYPKNIFSFLNVKSTLNHNWL